MTLDKQKSPNKNQDIAGDAVDGNISPKSSCSPKSSEDDGTAEVFPEFCRSKKEKECWKLFQKMLNKGVRVSYDTILRGMLTPTELRAVQKQKELDAAQLEKQESIDGGVSSNDTNCA